MSGSDLTFEKVFEYCHKHADDKEFREYLSTVKDTIWSEGKQQFLCLPQEKTRESEVEEQFHPSGLFEYFYVGKKTTRIIFDQQHYLSFPDLQLDVFVLTSRQLDYEVYEEVKAVRVKETYNNYFFVVHKDSVEVPYERVFLPYDALNYKAIYSQEDLALCTFTEFPEGLPAVLPSYHFISQTNEDVKAHIKNNPCQPLDAPPKTIKLHHNAISGAALSFMVDRNTVSEPRLQESLAPFKGDYGFNIEQVSRNIFFFLPDRLIK